MNRDPVINAPIESLQLMLKTISYALETIPTVNPDGIFDPATEQAVRAFQQEYGLPVTGVVDDSTFREIVRIYTIARELLETAQSPVIRFPSVLEISPGQNHPHVLLGQAMFTAIAGDFPEFSPLRLTGTVDAPTEKDIRQLQEVAGLPITGKLDKATWNRLAMLYRVLFDRNVLPSQG